MVATALSDKLMSRLEQFCISNVQKKEQEKRKNDESSDDEQATFLFHSLISLYGDLIKVKQDFSALQTKAKETIDQAEKLDKKQWIGAKEQETQQLELDDIFKDDPVEKDKFKSMIPGALEKDVMVYDYFEQNSKQQKIVKKEMHDPSSKGFDIRQFRLKQAAMRQEQESKNKNVKGLGQFDKSKGDDGFGISMMNMELSKADKMVIDSNKVIEQFNDEDAIKQDEEFMQDQKRKSFAFGGQNVRDRIQKRKQQRFNNQVTKIEKLISKRKLREDGQEVSDSDKDDDNNASDDEDTNNKNSKRQKQK
ncbi:UNKNOWN [Stylonychia lemnae]|uniref:Uncharacterized protein n=1 Tax=Stylonychia lemnae TaxID=5949 RepID=A0A078BEX3_STYLE|nr:UNKNOWN [Stylonychia lemnae]|eukprot:CDW91712.1 UNKNOWN [Stylonychia lemnae]